MSPVQLQRISSPTTTVVDPTSTASSVTASSGAGSIVQSIQEIPQSTLLSPIAKKALCWGGIAVGLYGASLVGNMIMPSIWMGHYQPKEIIVSGLTLAAGLSTYFGSLSVSATGSGKTADSVRQAKQAFSYRPIIIKALCFGGMMVGLYATNVAGVALAKLLLNHVSWELLMQSQYAVHMGTLLGGLSGFIYSGKGIIEAMPRGEPNVSIATIQPSVLTPQSAPERMLSLEPIGGIPPAAGLVAVDGLNTVESVRASDIVFLAREAILPSAPVESTMIAPPGGLVIVNGPN